MTEIVEINNDAAPVLKKYIGETAALAMATFGGYVIAAAYQIGYNTYFKLPLYFISVDIPSILIAIVALLGSIMLFSYLLGIINSLKVAKKLTKLDSLIYVYLIFVIVTLVYWVILMPPNMWEFLTPVIFLLSQAVISFVLPLFNKGVTYEEKLLRDAELDKNNPNSLLFQYLTKLVGSKGILYFFILPAMLIFFVYTAGYSKAEKSSVFDVLSTNPNMVILQNYKDSFILSPFNTSTKIIENKVYIMSISDLSANGFYYSRVKIGPLKPSADGQ